MIGHKKKQTVFLALWSTLFFCICAAIYYQDEMWVTEDDAVAELVTRQGFVTRRSEQSTDWQVASKSGKLQDGDRLAVGTGSSAELSLGSNRFVTLNEDSQIEISTIQQSGGASYIIRLNRGSVDVKVPLNAKHPVIVIAGKTSFQVQPGKKIGIEKKLDQEVRTYDPIKERPKSSKKSWQTMAFVPIKKDPIIAAPKVFELPKVLVNPEGGLNLKKTPEPVASPEVIVEVPTKEIEPVNEPPKATKPLKQIPSKALPPPPPPKVVAAELPPEPAVQLAGNEPSLEGSRKFVWLGSLSSFSKEGPSLELARSKSEGAKGLRSAIYIGLKKRQYSYKDLIFAVQGAVKVPMSVFLKEATWSTTNGMKCLTNKIFGAVSDDKSNFSISAKSVDLVVCPIAETLKSNGLRVSIQGAGSAAKKTGFIPLSKGEHSAADLIVDFSASESASSLLDLLRTSASFHIQASAFPQNGVFMARTAKVVAALSGKGLTSALVTTLLNMTQSDLVYKGNFAAILETQSLSKEDLRNKIGTHIASTNSIFIQSGSRLIPINRNFLKQRGEVADFVKNINGVIFLEPIEIIEYR